jgi:primosomal protein N' (replication factor Y)
MNVNYYLVCPIGVIAGKQDLLTYHSESSIHIGAIAEVPFGKSLKHAVVIKAANKPAFVTKQLGKILEEEVPHNLIDLSVWMSNYYAVRLTTVLQAVLPKGLGKTRRLKEDSPRKATRANTVHPLTSEQKAAIKAINESTKITHMLHGVTGSGKTRVYQEVAKKVLSENKSVLVLVPEISLTPQLAAEFEQLHEYVLVLHSGLTEAKRHTNWQKLKDTNHPWVVVGPRSSLFSPLQNLGLIIIDECHEPSYQQDSQPKYSALRVARKLAELSGGAKLLLGSATPLVSDYFVATATRAPIISLTKPTNRRDTRIEVVDMRERDAFGTHPLFSKKLLDAMNKSITQNEQILLFHNRRGTARMSLCAHCGWVAECPTCHLPLRLHHDRSELRCHTCGHSGPLPQTCPECKSTDIDFKGYGSKRIESEVRKLFPGAEVARFDGDTPVEEQLQNRYQDLYDNKIQIIIGTQGIAKGLDLPNLNTVGIVQADSELFIPDYSSAERSFQLTTQVIGRAGRSGSKSVVIIQTLNPDHPAIVHAKNQNYEDFYEFELEERRAEHMPPLTHLLQLTVGYASSKSAQTAADTLKDSLKKQFSDIHVRGPSPAFHEHRGRLYYSQLIVSCAQRSTLTAIANSLPARWQFTLDPINLL